MRHHLRPWGWDREGRRKTGVARSEVRARLPSSLGTPSAATWPAAPRTAACGSGTQLLAAVSASSRGTRSQSPVSGGEGTGSSTPPPRTAPSKSGGLMT